MMAPSSSPIVSRKLHSQGLLAGRIEAARRLLSPCTLCPRRCRVDRLAGETGLCATGEKARIASYGPHFGEEQPLVGSHGSGTVFFAGCNLRCCFCQNDEISQGEDAGREVDAGELAAIMLELQAMGCHNINLVTPSHVAAQILAALIPALEGGLSVPVVYNCSGYESLETLRLLDKVVDIYMPDAKFARPGTAARYCAAPDYPRQLFAALPAMHAQVGELIIDKDGVARRGLLIRHLLMPGLGEETRELLAFIAHRLSTTTYVNIMGQYHPCGRAGQYPELGRTIKGEEYRQALAAAAELGLSRLDQPDLRLLLRRLGV